MRPRCSAHTSKPSAESSRRLIAWMPAWMPLPRRSPAHEGRTALWRRCRRNRPRRRQWAAPCAPKVDRALTHRAELIPGFEQSLGALPAPASAVFRDLDQARAGLLHGRSPAEKFAANDRLSNALSRLLVLTEGQTALRSSGKLARLEEDLEGAENRIAVERCKYNEILEHYNSSIQMFPENLVAAISGFARNDNYFHTSQDLDTGAAARPRPKGD